jgi:hypothetical protein
METGSIPLTLQAHGSPDPIKQNPLHRQGIFHSQRFSVYDNERLFPFIQCRVPQKCPFLLRDLVREFQIDR